MINQIELSVIIPTYNRRNVLEKCIEALVCQSASHDLFEIIVSDDGSQDNTKDLVSFFSTKYSRIKLLYLWQANSGANTARNKAIMAASGRLLLFINDDTMASQDMISEHIRTHTLYTQESTAVLGKITISPDIEDSLFAKLHLDASFNLLNDKTKLDWRSFYTCNVSVKRLFLIDYGLFEEEIRYHEDLELSERLSHNGLEIIYNPKAFGYHYHSLEENEYLNIAKLEGEALAFWYKKSPHLKPELASIGFYLTMPFLNRAVYIFAGFFINKFTRPFILFLARYSAGSNQNAALLLYKKVFQSIKREAIKNALQK